MSHFTPLPPEKKPVTKGSIIGGCLIFVIAGFVVLMVLGFIIQAVTGSSGDDESAAEASASPSSTASASSTTPAAPVVGDYVGRPYEEVYDEITEAGGSIVALNAEDTSLRVPTFDSDWTVCDQNIPAGSPITEEVTVVAADEDVACLTVAEKQAFLAEQERVAAEEQAAREAEQAAREAEEAAPVVLQDRDINACGILAGSIDDVVTDQDRSDLARAVRSYSDDSTDPRFVRAGEGLTDTADAFIGAFWDASAYAFADLCIRGGYNDLPITN